MVDAVISVVLEQLASFISENVKLMAGVRKDVSGLTDTLRTLQAVIHDAEKRQITEETVKLWLDQLKAIVYHAEDVLDEWNTRLLKKKQNIKDDDDNDDTVSTRNKVLSYFSIHLKSMFVRYEIGRRIKDIREHVDEVTDKSKIYDFTQSHETQPTCRQQPTSSIIDVSGIFGRDHDKRDILSRLLGESSSRPDKNVHIISIVGTGGFGKTTLAKLILHEDAVKNAFERRMWVCVSQPFNLLDVAKMIIEEAGETVPKVQGWEKLHQCLCESLKGRRLLLVLDDVWTEDSSDWEPLKLALDGAARGSRILITTRNERVATAVSSTYIHNIEKLSDDDCWSLFRHIAFRGRQEELEQLEGIGKAIANRCKGVPLAAKALASQVQLLHSKREWKDVLESDIWEMQQTESGFLPSLFLSYYPLPSHLKQCFMYCAIFPEDAKIKKNELVKLWMAQGFLGSDSDGSTDLENIGERYFVELAMRSFFQDFEKDHNGRITSCKMHDLVHEFARYLSKAECFFVMEEEKEDKPFDGSKVRRSTSITHHFKKNSCTYKAKNIRTLQAHPASKSEVPAKFDKELRRLRVYILNSKCVENLPAKVEKLLHLRYLDLSYTCLRQLPETIGELYNLQTLKLNHCGYLNKLPEGIGNLFNLRHLEMICTNELKSFPRGIGRLRFLRTLSKFMVGGLGNPGCSLGVLKHLNFLQESLEIEGIDHVGNVNDAAEAELKKKKNLAWLTLKFRRCSEEVEDATKLTRILEALQPHENLEVLDISEFDGSKLPQWMSSNSVLVNLVTLRLNECMECAELPALGKLSSLETLEIQMMPKVKRIDYEFYGYNNASSSNKSVVAFPKLKTLIFSELKEWVMWEFPIDHNHMPHLCEFALLDCSKLRTVPDLRKFKYLETIRLIRMDELEELGEGKLETGSFTNRGGARGDAELPCLRSVMIIRCPKWKRIPPYMFSYTLRELYISNFPNLRRIQPCLPPLLEKLEVIGDVGIFSQSLPVNEEKSSHHNKSNYPHLRNVHIWMSPHPSLPKGFNHLTAIHVLTFRDCESLDFELNELKHLTELQHLGVYHCPILEKRFGEEDWINKLSHIPVIRIGKY